jgi:hypothetical protein
LIYARRLASIISYASKGSTHTGQMAAVDISGEREADEPRSPREPKKGRHGHDDQEHFLEPVRP